MSVRLDGCEHELGAVIDALVNAGANEMNGVSFAIRDSDPLLAQARGKAVADARSRAETYAKAAGVDLGNILSISEGGAVEAPRPIVSHGGYGSARSPKGGAGGAGPGKRGRRRFHRLGNSLKRPIYK